MRKILSFLTSLLIVCGMANIPTTAMAQGGVGECAPTRGNFTATLTGFTATITGTVQFRVHINCRVVMWTTAAITGTSNAATMTMTGLPYFISPNASIVASQLEPVIVQDNGALTTGCFAINTALPAVVTFSNTGACAGAMTSSAAKGLPAGWTVEYTLY